METNKEESKPTSTLLGIFVGSLIVAVTVLIISVISFQYCTLSFGEYTGICSVTQAATPGCDCTKIVYDPLYVNAMIISGGYIGMWILIGIGLHYWSKFRPRT